MLDTTAFVFVYGTLRKGGRLHGYLRDQGFISQATLPGFGMYPAGRGFYPGIVPRDGHTVTGEVWEVDTDCLWRLDRLEGHPNHYRRQPVQVVWGDGAAPYVATDEPVQVYIHQIPPETPEWIESGDWLEWLKFLYGDEED